MRSPSPSGGTKEPFTTDILTGHCNETTLNAGSKVNAGVGMRFVPLRIDGELHKRFLSPGAQHVDELIGREL